ncbi:hypothetical protein V1505DRAFT_30696 [Lipomyces doorenjongii]
MLAKCNTYFCTITYISFGRCAMIGMDDCDFNLLAAAWFGIFFFVGRGQDFRKTLSKVSILRGRSYIMHNSRRISASRLGIHCCCTNAADVYARNRESTP